MNSIDSKKETSTFFKKTEHPFPIKDPGTDFFKKILNSYKFVEDIEEQKEKFFQIDKCEVVEFKELPKVKIVKKQDKNLKTLNKKPSVRSIISERKHLKSQRQLKDSQSISNISTKLSK